MKPLLTLTAGLLVLGALDVRAADCEALAELELPDTRITEVEAVPAGRFSPPGMEGEFDVPAMCRVAGVTAPAIGFEVWMPEGSAWNGRFQAVGGGGLAGIISYPAMVGAVQDGFATASTDTGHQAPDTDWMRDRQQMIDYGYRAIHLMTRNAKAALEAYYGGPAAYSYFNGCSTGGRQGLMSAQRFPDDYDGILAGAPVNNFTSLHVGQLWTAHVTLNTPDARLSAGDFRLLSDAALAACAGEADGFVQNPLDCEFDPHVLLCADGQTDGCLRAEQVEAAQHIYAGAVNPRTGELIYPGLEAGGEAPQPGNPGWGLIMGDGPFFISMAVLGHMTFHDPDFDWRSFDFDRDVHFVRAKLGHVLDAVSPDLREFRERGGRLLIYHGWNDPGVMPREIISYHDDLVAFADRAGVADAAAWTDEYVRLFMMPGVGHCSGGAGPDQADFMDALIAWVEDGEAPERIVARRERDGEVDMTRPLCPHPQVARYRGEGDRNRADGFDCVAP